MIDTPRTRLRCWAEDDRDSFAALHADPEVMHDYGRPIDRAASDAKFDRYAGAFQQYGFCRWALETRDGDFLGYVGVMPGFKDHPLGPHFEIGWRLRRTIWGQGYATEAAKAALHDAFTRCGLTEILAYTGPDNLRSQGVMTRLDLKRDPSRDVTAVYSGLGTWHYWVWVAHPPVS